MSIGAIAESKLIADIGWTLLNSVWQIGIVAIALFVTHLLNCRCDVYEALSLSERSHFLGMRIK